MQIKLAWNDKVSQIDNFFWKMWKELFDIDCYNQIEAYKKCEIYYMQNYNKIISAIIFTNYKWKNYIWRFWTLAEYRNNWYWSSLIKTILNKYDDIYLEADEKQVNYYEKLWFKQTWENKVIWNTISYWMVLKK